MRIRILPSPTNANRPDEGSQQGGGKYWRFGSLIETSVPLFRIPPMSGIPACPLESPKAGRQEREIPVLTTELAALRVLTPVKMGLTVLLFMALLPQALFALVRRHFVALTLLTTRHDALPYLFCISGLECCSRNCFACCPISLFGGATATVFLNHSFDSWNFRAFNVTIPRLKCA